MLRKNETITPLPDNDPDAVPELWNSRQREVDENFAALDEHLESALESVAEHSARIAGVENQSAGSVAQALRLDWSYLSGSQIALELFYESWTLLPGLTNVVTDAVAGDDSLDLDSIAGIVPGKEYVLFDDTNQESIIITAILTATRVRCSANLSHSYSGASIKRTSWTVPGGKATATDGGIYYSGELNLGDEDQDKALIIRRDKNDADLTVFFKDADHEAWTRAFWGWEREISTGVVDIEYPIPARGIFEFKIVSTIGVSEIEPDIYHLACVNSETGLQGIHHPPAKPVNATPANAATNVQETPTLSVTSYVHNLSIVQGAMQVQVSLQADFSTILLDSGEQAAGISYVVPPGELAENGTYHWKMRLKDSLGGWSEWSDATSFTCAAAFTYVLTPSNVSPGAGDTNIAEQPTLSAGAFAAHGTTDTHAASQWRVRSSTGDWATPVYDSGESADLLSHVVPAGYLLEGENSYYFQTRYKGTALGWSDWSQETSFVTKDVFANIIGIAMVSSGGGAGTWQNIDADGNNITPDASYFNNHPVYGGIEDVTIDSQAMVKIPKFYIKVGTVPSGDQAGKKAWWISDQPVSGFALQPAFMDAGTAIDQFYCGKYEATNDGTKAGSTAGVAPLVSIDFPNMQGRCTARNTGGVDGFHMENIHELSAIQILCLIETGGPDVQSIIGSGNSSASAVVNTGASNAVWRGIHELWGNVRCMIDGAQFDLAHQIMVFDREGNNTYVATGVTVGAAAGWITGVYADIGAGYDLGTLFLGKTTDGTEGNGSFGDYQIGSSGGQNIYFHGGSWSLGSQVGLFCQDMSGNTAQVEPWSGSRLAKV